MGSQRYRCQECGHTFQASTDTIYAYAKLSLSKLRSMIRLFFEGYSVREAAKMLSINRNTVFLWRHKWDDTLTKMHSIQTLNKYVEADETYEEISYKGSREHNGFFIGGVLPKC